MPMMDFLRRRSDGSLRPSMETVATGSFAFGLGGQGWSRGHSMEAETESCVASQPQRDRVVMFPSRTLSGRVRAGRAGGEGARGEAASWGLDRLTGLEYKGRDAARIREDRVEQIVRGEAEGYEGEREDRWEFGTHAWGLGPNGDGIWDMDYARQVCIIYVGRRR